MTQLRRSENIFSVILSYDKNVSTKYLRLNKFQSIFMLAVAITGISVCFTVCLLDAVWGNYC